MSESTESIINSEGRCWLCCSKETKAKLKQAHKNHKAERWSIFSASTSGGWWNMTADAEDPQWQDGVTYQARRPAKPAPTHEEILTSNKYWEVVPGLWLQVDGYNEPDEYQLKSCARRKAWFATAQFADVPPEAGS